MILSVLTQKGGAGKTTVALHLAGELSSRGASVLVIDADPQGSALDWAEQRARDGRHRLFGVVGLARETLHREVPDLARSVDHVVIDGVALGWSYHAPRLLFQPVLVWAALFAGGVTDWPWRRR